MEMTDQHKEESLESAIDTPESNSENNTEQTSETENASDATANTENESAVLSLEDKLKEADDKYLRLYAEFENYKRRTSLERMELFKTANQEVLLALLPVLDDFGRALKAMETATDITAVKEGIELVNNKFTNILTNKGLKAMETKGKDFDVEFHEAITNIPAPSEDLKGKVIDEVERGYFLNDKVIRFAKVVVGE